PLGFGGLVAQLVGHGHNLIKYPLAHFFVLTREGILNGLPQSKRRLSADPDQRTKLGHNSA
ncbi:hypothetical protein, partial [Mycobacterium sp. E796]|uniref:hypothetical protein n=1 Tax=Mycobacterium sp. E796 TaxID=1834151 RepID=UPI0018D2F258